MHIIISAQNRGYSPLKNLITNRKIIIFCFFFLFFTQNYQIHAQFTANEVAERENVDIRYYDVIYNAIKDIRLAMAGLLEPVLKEHVIGRAEVKEIFRVPKVGAVAGCQVTDGHVDRNANVRLLRDDVVIFDGRVASLRRFKEDAKEVQSGYECGIGLENFSDIKPADIFEVYEVEEVAAEL